MSVVNRILSWCNPSIQSYLDNGPDQAIVFSRDKCQITANDLSTFDDEKVKTLPQMTVSSSLADRIKPLDDNSGVTIDEIFTLKIADVAARDHALQTWEPIKKFFWNATIVSGSCLAFFTVMAFFRMRPAYIISAGVGIAASVVITGNVAGRYIETLKQIDAWQNPGNQFALDRTAAYQKQFPALIENQLFPQGVLHLREKQSIYRYLMNDFAGRMLKGEINTPELEYQWLEQFFKVGRYLFNEPLLQELCDDDFVVYARGFSHFESLQITLPESKYIPIFKALAEIQREGPLHFARYVPATRALVEQNVQEAAAQLKESVLKDPDYLSKVYSAAKAMLKKASDETATDEIVDPGPRPDTFFAIPDDFYPSSHGDQRLVAFDAEVKKLAAV